MKVSRKSLLGVPVAILASITATVSIAQNSELNRSETAEQLFMGSYDKMIDSKSEILQYKKQVNKKNNRIEISVNPNERILVTVTLSKPLSEKAVQNLSEKYSLEVKQAKSRLKESDGEKSTLGSQPRSKDDLVSDMAVEHLTKMEGHVYVGIIELVGNMPANKIQPLSSSKLTFLVDPSADNYFTSSNPENDQVPGFYWSLENYNMVPKANASQS